AKAVMPVRVELDGDERGVVRPVLEKRAAFVVERVEGFAPVSARAREEDHVVGALHRVDGIELHEAELAHQRERFLMIERVSGAGPERVTVEKEAAGLAIRYWERRHAGRGSKTNSSLSPSGSANMTA